MPGALSARHVHAVIAAMVWVVRKKLISCKIYFSGMGCCRAVCHCIAPTVDIMLSPATRGENADAPHQSTPMNRKRESWIGAPKLHGPHCPLARNEIHQGAEVAGNVAKRPGDQNHVLAVRGQILDKGRHFYYQLNKKSVSARRFKHKARAYRGSRHGVGCQKETHQLHD
jgi:hypothetical protein